MRSSIPASRPVRGVLAPAVSPARRPERRTVLALIPSAPAVGMLRRYSAALLEAPRRPPASGRPCVPTTLTVPTESRLILRGGIVRAG